MLLLLLILNANASLDSKTLRVEKPVKYTVEPKDGAGLECEDPSRPYTVLSHKDKAKLEYIINNLKRPETDPNLL